jgi:hypothetical protein
MPNDSSTIKVTGFKIADQEFSLPSGEASMTVAELAARAGISTEGVTFILNGGAVAASAVFVTPVTPGSTVQVTPTAKGGRF